MLSDIIRTSSKNTIKRVIERNWCQLKALQHVRDNAVDNLNDQDSADDVMLPPRHYGRLRVTVNGIILPFARGCRVGV